MSNLANVMTRCPARDELQDFLSGRLSDAVADSLENHLETCATCQQALERLTESFDLHRNRGPQPSNEPGEELLCRLEQRPPFERGSPSGDGERSNEPGPEANRLKVTLVPGSGPQLAGEIQTVLHRRLWFLALLSSAGLIFPPIVLVAFSRGDTHLRPGLWPNLAVSLSTFALMLALAGALWQGRSFSLHRLRALELILFAAWVVFWSWFDVFLYPEMRLPEPPDWFGFLMAKAISIPWVVIIIAYGIFVPNTWRRCAAVVGIMAVAPIVVSSSTGLAADVSKDRSPWIYLLTASVYMGTAAAIATYGAHRIEILRQQAQVARRLGQYQLKERLGAGGMGEVYLAEHVLLRRPCALKLIRQDRLTNASTLRRFEREVQVTATLTHPNTVEILDYGHVEDGTFYYVMEYLPGLTLEQLVGRYGPLPPERVIHFVRQVCGALQEAHSAGLIHRDIKPGNILICERGGQHDVAKLLDFGLVHDPLLSRVEQKLTEEGVIAGTPGYMSPEQVTGRTNLDRRSDIYSLGAVAYFLLAGRPPYVRQTAMQTLAAQLYEAPVALDQQRPDIPSDLRVMVERCLEKDPERRFATAATLEEALARCACANSWTREQASAWWQERHR